MNDEIKEILEEIDNKIIPNEHWNKIKDYITNLQEENESLGEQISNSLKLCEELIKEKDKLYNHLCLEMRKDDKKIIKKAIDYIKTRVDSSKASKYELLDILNGGDEEWKKYFLG